jgi:hypothetical protein
VGKVNNCAEYMELISAYADDELAGSDKQLLEHHLGMCANCSSLLEVYREVSLVATESNVPAPEALRDGVMHKVLNEGQIRAAGKSSSRKVTRIVLSRYVPAAACLAVLLLTLPWITNLRRQGAYVDHLPALAPMADSAMMTEMELRVDSAPAAGGGAVPGGTGRFFTGSGAFEPPAPGAALPGGDADRGGETGLFRMDIDTPSLDPSDDAVTWAEETNPALDPTTPELANDGITEPALDSSYQLPGWQGHDPMEPPAVTPYFVSIIITGEDFPAVLLGYDPMALDDVTDAYLVSRDVALMLIEELSGRDGVFVSDIYEDSYYALVVYHSP